METPAHKGEKSPPAIPDLKIIDASPYWQISKDNCNIYVMVDNETRLVELDIGTALATLTKALEARNLGAKAAIRSLSQSIHSEQSETVPA
jgi:hypothetical protein